LFDGGGGYCRRRNRLPGFAGRFLYVEPAAHVGHHSSDDPVRATYPAFRVRPRQKTRWKREGPEFMKNIARLAATMLATLSLLAGAAQAQETIRLGVSFFPFHSADDTKPDILTAIAPELEE